ncbi:MAG: hypothetical protein OER86_01395, partial [Phycisphaerae bacterium]|nr:hypothetical protein [Phycisphaerae bacterium]
MTDPDRRAALDRWMADHPWHPRLLPLFVYVVFLMGIGAATDWQPQIYPLLYALQCVVVAALLWRYRSLLGEMNFRFHWLAVPAAAAGAAAWIGLGRAMMDLWPQHFAPEAPPTSFMDDMGPAVGWTAMGLRLLGMSLLVPVIEELFYRSALL